MEGLVNAMEKNVFLTGALSTSSPAHQNCTEFPNTAANPLLHHKSQKPMNLNFALKCLSDL